MNSHPHRCVVELEVLSGLGFTKPTNRNPRSTRGGFRYALTHPTGLMLPLALGYIMLLGTV